MSLACFATALLVLSLSKDVAAGAIRKQASQKSPSVSSEY
jgi:hypothetical protein